MRPETMEEWVAFRLEGVRQEIFWVTLVTEKCKWMKDTDKEIKLIDKRIQKLIKKLGETK